MAKTYSYDPTLLDENGVDLMRFELGDTMVEGKEETCVLCDEEYQAMIDKASKAGRSWKYATFLCLKAIRMKLSFEVNSSIAGLNLSLIDRFKTWDEMYKAMSKSFQVPTAGGLDNNCIDGGHYFKLGQGNNPRAGG